MTCDGSEQGQAAHLWVRSSAPTNSIATTTLPLLGKAVDVTVGESGPVLWRNSGYVPGAEGVTKAVASDILVSHGSDTYDFWTQ
eukprot:SAG31_NODE_815_length_11876_cov_2.189182_1_plen_84_part_00